MEPDRGWYASQIATYLRIPIDAARDRVAKILDDPAYRAVFDEATRSLSVDVLISDISFSKDEAGKTFPTIHTIPANAPDRARMSKELAALDYELRSMDLNEAIAMLEVQSYLGKHAFRTCLPLIMRTLPDLSQAWSIGFDRRAFLQAKLRVLAEKAGAS